MRVRSISPRDVYHLLSSLRQALEHGDLKLYNQDLAGFSTSIDQKRFIGARQMLLDFLRPHMDASDKITKRSLSIQDEATTLETSSRDEGSES